MKPVASSESEPRQPVGRATIYDVARTAGVSPATVSRLLNGTARVAAKTQERIYEAVALHGFTPNAIAQSLATRTSRTIAALVPDITNPFFPEIIKGVQQYAEEKGFSVLLCNTGHERDGELRYLDLAWRKQVDGILLVSADVSVGAVEELRRQGIAVVAIDPRDALPASISVKFDHQEGARRATQHLIDLGHTKIAHLVGPPDFAAVAEDRLSGYRKAMAENGLLVTSKMIARGGFTEESGRVGMDELSRAGVESTAVFAANDLCAIGVIDWLEEKGIKVPAQTSVIGYDGIQFGRYTKPPLTTVAQPLFEIGRTSAEMLITELGDGGRPEHAEQPCFVPELVVRGSTAPAAGPQRVRKTSAGR